MANMTDLLGALMRSGMTGSSSDRVQHSLGEKGLGGAGGLLGQLIGMATDNPRTGSGSPASPSGGSLGALGDMVGSFFDQGGKNKSLATGGLGALAGALLGGGKDSAKGGLGGGALALIGSLALQAFQNASQTPDLDPTTRLTAGLRPPETREEEDKVEEIANLTVKAMVNAAKSDGRIDENEMKRIAGEVEEGGVTSEEREYLMRILRQPMDTEGLVRDVPNPQVAAQIYAASLFAIEADTPAEKKYLQDLAEDLALDPQVVRHLHGALGLN